MTACYGNHPPIPIDLLDRARLGLHFLEHSLDRRHGYLPNIIAVFEGDQAVHRHDFADFGDLTSRYLEAFILARRMTGSDAGEEAFQGLQELFLSYFRDDGLSYRPPIDHPFQSFTADRPYQPNMAEGFDQSRVMFALLTWFTMTGDDRPRELMDRMIHGVRGKGVVKDDRLYFTQPAFGEDFEPNPDAPPYPQQLYFSATMILPLLWWHELTGSAPALETARQLKNFVMRDEFYFGRDGSFRALDVTAPGSWDLINGHTHSRLGAVAGLLRYGRVCNDEPTFSLGRSAFDWFLENHCLPTGWCPEFVGRHAVEAEGCETCTLMDLAHCCLELCAAGEERYWNTMERLVRNQLLEQQITDASFIPSQDEPGAGDFQSYPISGEAVLGGFGGWVGVNDFVGHNEYSHYLMHCCGPSGIKALYLAWQQACKFEEGVLRVNLLLPRRLPEADVQGFDPREGRLDIELHTDAALSMRMPDWVAKKEVRAQVERRPLSFQWQADRLVTPVVEKGQTVSITYPLRSVTSTVHVGSDRYDIQWQGDTALSISPPGTEVPLYTRQELLQP